MKSFIKILKKYIFILFFLIDIRYLRHELVEENGSDVVVGKGNGQQILLFIDSYARHT